MVMAITPDIGRPMMRHRPKTSKLTLKGLGVHLEMGVLQRGQLYQAAGQAHLVSPARVGQAGWSQVVAACPPPKGFNLGMNPKHLSPEHPLQEVAVMTHFGALNSFQSAQERGSKVSRFLLYYLSKICLGTKMVLQQLTLYMCIHCWVHFTVEKLNEVSP